MENELEEAKSNLERLLRQKPYDFNTRTRYGTILFRLNDFENAIKQFQKALDTSPDSFKVNCMYGWALYGIGDHEGAMARVLRCARLSEPQNMNKWFELWVDIKKAQGVEIDVSDGTKVMAEYTKDLAKYTVAK